MPEATLETGAVQDKAELYDHLMRWFRILWPRDAEYRKEAKEDFKFYHGDKKAEWGDALQEAQASSQPTLVINRCRKQVRAANGFFEENKQDIRILPRDASINDFALSTLMTDLVKHESDRNALQWQMSRARRQAIICGRGFLKPWIDENGEVKIEWVPWHEILKDDASRFFDMRDAQVFFHHMMLDAWAAEKRWPQHAAKIKDAIDKRKSNSGSIMVPDTGLLAGNVLHEGDPVDGYNTPDIESLFIDEKREQVRVIEAWYRVPAKADFVFFRDTGEKRRIGREEFDSLYALDPTAVFLGDQQATNVRTAVMMPALDGKEILEDGPTPFTQWPLSEMLPLIPVYWEQEDNGEGKQIEYGVIRDLKDPQVETNKRRSQGIELVSRMKGLWVIRKNSVADIGKTEEALAQPEGIVWIDEIGNIQRIGPENVPNIFAALDEMSRRDFFDIAFNPDLLGMPSNAESGRAILARSQAGQLQISDPFSNYIWTVKLTATWLMGMIQQTYTDGKILAVTGEDGKRRIMEINQEREGTSGNFIKNADGSPFEDPSTGVPISGPIRDFRTLAFDVVVSTSPFSPTTRLAALSMFQELSNRYEIPLEFILEMADIPGKEKLLRSMGQLRPTGLPKSDNALEGATTPQTDRSGNTVVRGLPGRGGGNGMA